MLILSHMSSGSDTITLFLISLVCLEGILNLVFNAPIICALVMEHVLKLP